MVLLQYGLKNMCSTYYLYHQLELSDATVFQIPILTATPVPLAAILA